MSADMIEDELDLADAHEPQIAACYRLARARSIKLVSGGQRVLRHRPALEMVAVFVRTVRDRLADFLGPDRVQDAIDRILHEIADRSRQPMTATDEHVALGPDVEALERQRTNELLQIAVVRADEFFQTRRHLAT